jgi:hypothetical protein
MSSPEKASDKGGRTLVAPRVPSRMPSTSHRPPTRHRVVQRHHRQMNSPPLRLQKLISNPT